jgi:hypothetical protein
MSVTIKRKNPKWIDDYSKFFAEQTGREVAVGLPKEAPNIVTPHYDNGASILDVALGNNFGTEKIPRRPFMDNASPKLQKMWKKLLERGFPTRKAALERFLKTAALQAEVIVRAELDATNEPPNAPQTVKAKGSSKPLIDSGDLRKYIQAVVRDKTTI